MSDKPRFEARQYYDNAWDVFDYEKCIYVVTKLDKRTAHLFAAAEEMAALIERMHTYYGEVKGYERDLTELLARIEVE